MNDSLYEEYMRSVLGYQPVDYRDTYNMNYDNYMPVSYNMQNFSNANMQNEELEKCYPDIYRIVYPMVQKACIQNTKPMTRELVDNMTNEIYLAIEDNQLSSAKENRNTDTQSKTNANNTSSTNNRNENRSPIRNQGLNDLIRILILRELLGRPGFPIFPGRPPRPPMRPPRPPMRPPMRPPRPRMEPFNRQSYNSFGEEYDDIFEY